MKIALIVILVIAVGLLAYDDQNLRSEAKNLEKDRTTAMDGSNLATGQVNGLNTKVSQLNQQISGLQFQIKNLQDAASAAASAPAAPAQPPVAANGTAPASGTPATPGAPPAQDPASSTQLVDSYSNALAIVEGKNGVGSGFVCNMDGKTYVITNAHVLADNPEFKVTSIKGTVYNVGASAVAVGRDLVKMEVTGAPKAFDIASSTDGSVKIGDAITVLGNPEGAGVVKPVEGKILGIGPDLIEVDAQFVPGNSGSPIIHQATGKVLGVATYTVERKVNNGGGGVQTEVRRFGYRLDGVKQWEQINW
ncbi:MAG TPA: serine protease, partial [Verrucomicrobiae bacterium]|nr:serine protease [Verrucomicrobiae bacterium]